MECSHTPEILRLAPNSVFVSLTPPLQLCSLSYFLAPFSLLVNSLKTVRMPSALRPHYACTLYLGASYSEDKYNHFNGFLPTTYAFFFPYVPFLHHYMHRYDLSFGHAGLPGSCIYALRSR